MVFDAELDRAMMLPTPWSSELCHRVDQHRNATNRSTMECKHNEQLKDSQIRIFFSAFSILMIVLESFYPRKLSIKQLIKRMHLVRNVIILLKYFIILFIIYLYLYKWSN